MSGGCLPCPGTTCCSLTSIRRGTSRKTLGDTDTEIDDAGKALAGALAFGGAPAAVTVRPNLDVLVGGYHLNAAAAALTNMASRDSRSARLALAEILAPLVLQSHLWLVSAGSVVALAGPVLVAASPG
jgi:chromosome partitioning protein